MAKLDLGPEDITSLFPEKAEERFNVTKEEREKLFEESREDEKTIIGIPSEVIPFAEQISGTKEQKYVESLKEAEEGALQNKLEYISEMVGSPVENTGLTNYKDIALTFQLSRSKYFKNRQKKFLGYYPEGDYQRQIVDYGDGTTDKLELFKYDKNDKKWQIANPYGRDWGEIGRVTGTIIDEAFATDVASLAGPELLKKSKNLKMKAVGYALDAIPPTVRVTIANFLGLKGKKLNEFLLGYGEEGFDVDNFDEIKFLKEATDLSDWSQAFLAGGLYKGTTEFSNYVLKGKRPGMVPMGEDIIRASEDLGLDPLVFAQLAASPIIRRMYSQAGLFVKRNDNIETAQIKKLESVLKEFGIGNGDKQLDFGKLQALNEQLALNVGKDIKLVSGGKYTNLDEANIALQQSLKQWSNISVKTQDTLRNSAIKTAKESGESVSFNLTQFQSNFKKQMQTLYTMVKPGDKVVKVKNEAGEIVEQTVKGGKIQPFGGDLFNVKVDGSSSLGEMFKTIKKIGNGANSLKDPTFKNFNTLLKMREDLSKLSSHPNERVNQAATALHTHIVKILNGKSGNLTSGANGFKHYLGMIDNHMSGMENVRNLSFVKEALTKGGDPDKFVNQFMSAGSPIKVTALKNMFLEGTEGPQREAAEKAFNVFKSAWLANTLKSPDGIKIIDDFLINDPKSLEILLGPQFKAQSKVLKNIIYKQNKVSNGIVADTIKGGDSKEFAQTLIDKSKQKIYQGMGKDFDEIIDDLGGVDSNAINTVRYHIINSMIDTSRTVAKDFSNTMDPKILRNEIRKLQANPYLMKFFDETMIKDLQNFNIYTTALAGGNDVGGMIAAGAEVAEFVDKWNVPKLAFSLFKYELIARLLSKKATSSLLKDLDASNALSPNNLRVINGALAELEKDVLGEVSGDNIANDKGVLFQLKREDLENFNESSSIRPSTNTDNLVKEIPMANFNPSPVNSASRLSAANIATPITDPGPMNPNTMARGQQLFGGPGEITFAAEGGIMNARKPIQRVA